jgi:hypothetical protein
MGHSFLTLNKTRQGVIAQTRLVIPFKGEHRNEHTRYCYLFVYAWDCFKTISICYFGLNTKFGCCRVSCILPFPYCSPPYTSPFSYSGLFLNQVTILVHRYLISECMNTWKLFYFLHLKSDYHKILVRSYLCLSPKETSYSTLEWWAWVWLPKWIIGTFSVSPCISSCTCIIHIWMVDSVPKIKRGRGMFFF